MSEEEKKALEKIDYIQDFIIENGQYNADVNDMEYFSKILNLIEKQQKELNSLKEIEQRHREINGKLRAELEQEKEINKEIAFKNHKIKEESNAYGEEIIRLDNELKQEKEKYKRLQNTEAFQECYISKDKIKNILDKFNKGEYHYIHDLMQEIQELLEEK